MHGQLRLHRRRQRLPRLRRPLRRHRRRHRDRRLPRRLAAARHPRRDRRRLAARHPRLLLVADDAGRRRDRRRHLRLQRLRARADRPAPTSASVNPSIPHWGGPTGLNTTGIAAGRAVYTLRQLQPALRHHPAVAQDGREPRHRPAAAGPTRPTRSRPGIPGDSGSAMLDARAGPPACCRTLALAPLPRQQQLRRPEPRASTTCAATAARMDDTGRHRHRGLRPRDERRRHRRARARGPARCQTAPREVRGVRARRVRRRAVDDARRAHAARGGVDADAGRAWRRGARSAGPR